MYYDGASWKWDKSEEVNITKAEEVDFLEAYKKIVKDYGKKLKGDEMDESLVTKLIADLDKITNKIEEIQAGLKVEKKEQRRLWKQILDEAMPLIENNLYVTCSKNAAHISIDAVIECYEDWCSVCRNVTFPEYLKEKLG